MAVSISSLRPRSERSRIYVYAAVAFIVLSFATTAVFLAIVNHLKNRLIEQAKKEMQQSMQRLGEDLATLLEESGVQSLEDLDPAQRERLLSLIKSYVRDETALTIFTLIEDGRAAYYIDQGNTELGELALNPTPPGHAPPGLNPDDPRMPPRVGEEEDIVLPLGLSGMGSPATIGIAYRMSPERLASALKDTSRDITRVSWLLLGLLLFLMLAGIISLARVLAHLVTLHDEANRLDRLAYVGTLAAGLAHEIRNPLNAMNINLDLVADDLGTGSHADPATRELVSNVKSEIRHLNKIVENFLAYARPTRRVGETVDFGKAVREAITVLQPEFESRCVEVLAGELPDGAAVEIDPTSLHQTLVNILLNAAQAMDKPDRRITVSGQCDGGRVDLTIADTGKGIPPEEMQSIFEVFYTTKPGGSGLGLSTARRVIEDSGGELTVDSVAGQGTRVTIELPVARRRGLLARLRG